MWSVRDFSDTIRTSSFPTRTDNGYSHSYGAGPLRAGSSCFRDGSRPGCTLAFFFVNSPQKPKKTTRYGYHGNSARHPLRRRKRPHHHPLRRALVASFGGFVQLLSGHRREDRPHRHRGGGFRQPPVREHPRSDRRTEDRLPRGEPHGTRPLLVDRGPAAALPRPADRRQRQDAPDDRRLLRHRHGDGRGRGGFDARSGRQGALVPPDPDGPLAGDDGDVVCRRGGRFLGRRVRHVRRPRRRHHRFAGRTRNATGTRCAATTPA